MEGGPTKDAKKTVCRTFTNVLKASPLRESINPKEFYMMMSANFAVLYQNGRVDLSPLWGALVANHPPEDLYGLFLKFSEAGESIGVEVGQPSAVQDLSPEDRARYLSPSEPGALQNFSVRSDSIAELEALSIDDLKAALPPDEQPPVLGTGDLRPIVPEEHKRKIIQTVVQAVKSAPIGAVTDGAQLAYQLDNGFDELCNGEHFNFEPVLGALRQLESYRDEDVYAAIVNAKAELEKLGVSMDEPALELHPDVKKRLLEQAKAAPKPRISSTLAQTKAETTKPPPEPKTKTQDVPKKSEERLKELGLSGQKKSRGKQIRLGIMVLVAVVLAVVLFLNRPNRPLGIEQFKNTIPMKSAGFQEGYFRGYVNDSGWYKLNPEVRNQRFKNFVTFLKSKGWSANAQVYDSQNRLVITNADSDRLVAATFFIKGNRDGSVPEAETPPKKP